MSQNEAQHRVQRDEEWRAIRDAEVRRIVKESLEEDDLALERDAKYAFAPSAVFQQ